MSASVYRKPVPASPSPPMATSTSPATPQRKWSIDDAHASRLYSPASPALYGVEMLGASPAPGSSSPNTPYAFDDEHAYAYRYSLFDDYAESADDDLYPHALAPMPVASSSKLLLHQAPKPASLSEPVQNFFDLDLDPESQIDQPYEYSYEYGVGLARRQFAEKRERRRGGVCEWDFALLDSERGHGHDQDHLDAAVPDWSPLSDLSLASTNTDSPNADHDPTFGPEVIDSTGNPSPNPNTSSPSYALRKARTAIGNTDAEEMARAMIGLGLVRPSYRPPGVDDVDSDERARESWRELGFGNVQRELGFGNVQQEGEEKNAGGSGGGSGWMWATEDAPGLLEGNMSFIDTEGTDVVSHLDLDFDEDENEELDGGEGHGNAYTHTHAPVDTAADTDADHDHDRNTDSTPFRVSPPHSSPPLPTQPPQTHQHLTIPVPTSTPHSQLTLRGTRASALVDWAALALDAALREDPGRCWAAVCFGDVYPPHPGAVGEDTDTGADAGLYEGAAVGAGLGTRGREREMLAFSHALASPELEVREVHSGARAGDRPPEAEAEAEPEAETSARRASEPDLRLEPAAPAQTTRGRSQRRKQLPPTSPALRTQTQTHTRTRPRIVTTTTVAASPDPAPTPAHAPIPATTSTPASQSQTRHRGRTRTRERTPVDPVLCATPATTPPSSALALVSVSPASLGMDPEDVPPVPPLPPSANQPLPANHVAQDDEEPALVAPSLAPLLAPTHVPAPSTGVPALRLDTSWSGPAPGSINSIPLPSMGRRVIGSEGDVFSHVSASQSPHSLLTHHEGNTDADARAQEVQLPTRNVHDDAIFAALLTPTAPLALSPTRPPAPRYRPLSDPPPYTAAVAGSNTHPHGLARGVSPGLGGSPGIDAEVSA